MAKLGHGAVFMLMMWLCVGSWESAFGQDNPPAASATAQSDAETGKAADQGLVIEPEELPQTYPHGDYHVQFQARGNYVPVLQWKVQSGSFAAGDEA